MIMAAMRRRHDDTEEDEAALEQRARRQTDKLLTFDRAMLVLIFAVGGWVATADLRQADLKTRVEMLEQRGIAATLALADQDREIALLRNDMQYLRGSVDRVEQNLSKLAESTARLVDRLKTGEGGR